MTDSIGPGDIHPESGFRLPLPRREDLDDAARKIYDQLCDPDGGSLAGLRGPGGIRLHSPGLAVLTSALNRYLRNETEFGGRVRELAILATARELDSQFEWAAHEAHALREGLDAETIETVRRRGSLDRIPEPDAIVIRLARELFRERRVEPETFARALDGFGPRGLVDLVSLMGLYAATAALLTAFDAQLADGQAPPLPPP